MKKKIISLALQGGGTHLAFSWGVIDYLLEDGRFEIEGGSGTSAGGLTCAALAQGLLKDGSKGGRKELAAFWDMVSVQGALLGLKPSYLDKLFSSEGMGFSFSMTLLNSMMMSWFQPTKWNPYGIKSFKNLLNDFFDFEKLANNEKFKLFITATNVMNAKLKIFKGKELTADAFMASACVPLLSPPVEIDGELYWDGAYIGNPSLFPLINDCESSDIVVILVIPHQITKPPTSVKDIKWRMQELFHTNALIREMRAIDFITSLIDNQKMKDQPLKKVNIHVIEDNEFFSNLDSSSRLNTESDFLKLLYERGRVVAKNWVDKNYKHVGNRSSIDIKETFM